MVVMVANFVVTMLRFKMGKQVVPIKSVVMTMVAMMTMTMTSMTAMSALIKKLYILKCKTFIFYLL